MIVPFTSAFETPAVLDFDPGIQVVQVACAGVCKVAAHSGPLENFANERVKPLENSNKQSFDNYSYTYKQKFNTNIDIQWY